MIGSMAYYITHADPKNFQPMNANFGIMRLEVPVRRNERKEAYAPQSLKHIREMLERNEL